MSNRPGRALFGRKSMAMGSNDPRERRNAQAESAPNINVARPLIIDNNQRITLDAAVGVQALPEDATLADVIEAYNGLVARLKESGQMRR